MEPTLTRKKTVNLERRAEIGRERKARTRAAILAAAFDIFGDEKGLFARIEDVADSVGVTRATFYNHFSGMEELRDALSHEVTHDFLAAVMNTFMLLESPAERAGVAVRLYLHRARENHRWGWSMINLSASGVIFGAETNRQAEMTIQEGMESGCFIIPSSKVGRDILLGSCLAAMSSITREETEDPDYPETVAGYILFALGVPWETAREMAHRPLPPLLWPEKAGEGETTGGEKNEGEAGAAA